MSLSGKASFKDSVAIKEDFREIINPFGLVEAPANGITAGEATTMTIEAEALPGLRVDQVGSLLRPPELIECFKLHARGQTSDEQLRPRKFGVRS